MLHFCWVKGEVHPFTASAYIFLAGCFPKPFLLPHKNLYTYIFLWLSFCRSPQRRTCVFTLSNVYPLCKCIISLCKIAALPALSITDDIFFGLKRSRVKQSQIAKTPRYREGCLRESVMWNESGKLLICRRVYRRV